MNQYFSIQNRGFGGGARLFTSIRVMDEMTEVTRTVRHFLSLIIH